MRRPVNMSGVQEGGNFEPPPQGAYDCEIIEVIDTDVEGNPRMTKNGDPMVNIKLMIIDGEYSGKFLWDNINFAAGILGRTKHFLHCIGCEYEGEFEWDSDEWKNKMVRIETKIEPPNTYHQYDKAVVKMYVLSDEKITTESGPLDNAEMPF